MFKFNRDQLKGFVLGVVSVILFTFVVGSVFASTAGKLVDIKVVKGGIKIFIDGHPFVPMDANGNVVEPFIYEGTTYLPLRALATAFSKDAKWDAETSSVYLGKIPESGMVDIAALTPYNTNGEVLTGDKASFYILDKKTTPFNRLDPSVYGEYKTYGAFYDYILDSKYRSLNGQFVIPFTNIGSKGTGKVKFFSLTKKGEETLIKEVSASIADDPVEVNVDLRGVEILRIEFDDDEASKQAALYNVTLTLME